MMSAMQRRFDQLRRKLYNRIAAMAQRVVLQSLAETQANGFQIVTVRGVGSHVRRAERIGQAGLTARPTAGDGVQIAVGGRTDHPVVVALENNAKRPTDLAPGETTVYNEFDARMDQKITGETHLHAGGALDFVALAAKVLTELDDIRTQFDIHTHGGVTVGAGLTAVPTPVPPFIPLGPAGPVAASKIKAE